MRRMLLGVTCALLLLGTASESHAGGPRLKAGIVGNSAGQEIAGFKSSGSAWTINRGFVKIFPFGPHLSVIIVKVRRLVLDLAGFNPSPTFQARIVCHDSAGEPCLAASTEQAPLEPGIPGEEPGGNGTLLDVIALPDPCFAPIVLLGGDPNGPRPGFFAVSGL